MYKRQIFAFDTTTGVLLQQHRFKRDMFNSAPLVVTGSDGAVNVYVSTTLGNIYCYSAASVQSGPLWVSADLPAIPVEDLPASTYTFLSVTQKGTLLATSTAGGALWQVQKATFAIANGLLTAPGGSNMAAGGALSPPAAAGVSSVVLLLGAAAAYFAYGRVPAFKGAVDAAAAHARSLAGSGGGGGGGSGGGGKASASSSLLRTGSGGGGLSAYSAVPVSAL